MIYQRPLSEHLAPQTQDRGPFIWLTPKTTTRQEIRTTQHPGNEAPTWQTRDLTGGIRSLYEYLHHRRLWHPLGPAHTKLSRPCRANPRTLGASAARVKTPLVLVSDKTAVPRRPRRSVDGRDSSDVWNNARGGVTACTSLAWGGDGWLGARDGTASHIVPSD